MYIQYILYTYSSLIFLFIFFIVCIFICSVFSLHKDRYDHYVFCVYRAIIKQITEQNNIEQKLTHIC